jgi:type VI protein secretion system component VasK
MNEKEEDQLEERIWNELQTRFKNIFDLYDHSKKRDTGLQSDLTHIINEDRDLMTAFLSLAAQRKAARTNWRLTLAVLVVSAVAAFGTVIQALIAAHVLV